MKCSFQPSSSPLNTNSSSIDQSTRSPLSSSSKNNNKIRNNKRDREYDIQDTDMSKRILNDGIRSLSLEQQFLVESTTQQPSNIDHSDSETDSEMDPEFSDQLPTIHSNATYFDDSIEKMSANYGDSPEAECDIEDENNVMDDTGQLRVTDNDNHNHNVPMLPPLSGQKHTRKVDFLIDNLIRKERRLLELRTSGASKYSDGYYLDGSDVGIPHSVGPQPTVDQALLSVYRWPVVCDKELWAIDTTGSLVLVNNSSDHNNNPKSFSGTNSCSYPSKSLFEGTEQKVSSLSSCGARHSNDMTHSDWAMEYVDDFLDTKQ